MRIGVAQQVYVRPVAAKGAGVAPQVMVGVQRGGANLDEAGMEVLATVCEVCDLVNVGGPSAMLRNYKIASFSTDLSAMLASAPKDFSVTRLLEEVAGILPPGEVAEGLSLLVGGADFVAILRARAGPPVDVRWQGAGLLARAFAFGARRFGHPQLAHVGDAVALAVHTRSTTTLLFNEAAVQQRV